MSLSSRKKAPHLRLLNEDKLYLAKRRASRQVHEHVVAELVSALRGMGMKCYVLSEYVKETRTPDAIVFNGKKLVALEVEQEKRYKPTNNAVAERLSDLNALSGFFDFTETVFVPKDVAVQELAKAVARRLVSKD